MELAWWLGESSVTEAAGLASFCAGLPGVSQSMEESAGRKVEGDERPRGWSRSLQLGQLRA